ncbi:arginyl-tRNA--protein transferase 1 isoform X1 [Tachysurus vachellii]|uniref:arginyl-tRNA--protein transferase 1 isoform X1 n=1 Tax=Tachysurus vachellii TaxID=175792 RepID=UPI00296B065B|nr:arginyl-tRNA--protein transferase 1 isoform X1 [Tachysurus vachellii]
MAAGGSLSVVEYFGGDDGHRCGYCKNATGNFSHGMWAHSLTVQDYQDLIDRGWRRSGKYVYKPFMSKTCCPQYTIRCHALNFHPSKTHKKILKKMTKFLSKGEKPAARDAGCDGEQMDSIFEEVGEVPLVEPVKIMHTQVENPIISSGVEKDTDSKPSTSETSREETVFPSAGKSPRFEPKPGVGADPCKPQCRKAKDIRKERRLQKEQKKQQDGGSISTNPKPATATPASGQPKPLEEFITDSLPDDPLHRLEVRLVPVSFEDPDFLSSYKQSVELFARYQMAIHDDDPVECDESQFKRFLCDSPLEAETSLDGPEMGYGSFHQQYWLDGRIVAVGVIDILPNCVSSVYLYYHPDFAFLSLGSYSALREIAFTRHLQKQSPKLSYYYLGFYIHSCPKMRYKGQYLPSDLLCPETYTWVPIEKCVPRLETSAYSRLHDDARAGDVRALKDLGRVLVLHKRTVMPYAAYSRKRKGCNDEKEVEQYARLLGQTCAERILLYRS